MARIRLDKLVVERGLLPTREKARRLILAGEVLVNERPVDKPGTAVPEDAAVRLRSPLKDFVGRGGDKLKGALDALGLGVEGLHVLDVGASTGGFTDCLLQRGAAEVTAVDVGHAQLDWKLRSDPRVHAVEGVNARNLSREDFPGGFDMITVDVSFISLTKVLPALAALLNRGGRILMLVKPQFELAPRDVGRGGLVLDPQKHAEAVERVRACAEGLGVAVQAVVPSALRGAKGNQEFFLLASAE